MNSFILKAFQIWFKIIETIVPNYAKRRSVKLFFSPHNFQMPTREKLYIKLASKKKVDFNLDIEELYKPEAAINILKDKSFNSAEHKDKYTIYELGDGPPVLLVHGWSGRASQMGDIAIALAEHGYKTISLSAFAHNGSLPKQTTVIEFAEIIKDISKNNGPFKAVIGHSLGGIALGNAILKGIETEKFITIGSPTTFQYILEAYGEIVNASQSTLDYIKDFVIEYTKVDIDDFSLRDIGSHLSLPGLIIHDQDDKEAIYSQALLFNETWGKGQLITTNGLGHSRILRDKKVIKLIADYIKSGSVIYDIKQKEFQRKAI